ncbi:Toll-like receptor [Elysia marginata]|uniref:Toll-like receptor n=1 Tax=Elysia marginata TaxID=1093978 RepID=A0AAV4HJI6_9GAST|nr:Toll-like receptor [Elysia marginata]
MDLDDQLWNLKGLTGLLYLDVSHNKLQRLDQTVLNKLDVLEDLYLNDNLIRELPREAFGAHRKLTTLDLSQNQIQTVPAQAFSGAREIKGLYLQRNQIDTLEGGVLINNGGLIILDLSHNRLTSLPSQLLSAQMQLSRLDISYNQLGYLEDDIFFSTIKLTSLNVSHNRLTALPRGKLPRHLEYLDFSFNEASGEISPDLLRELSKVKEIHLGHNKISSLPLQVFGSCSKLKYLDMSHNEISHIEETMFYGAAYLEEIDLSYNQLTNIKRVFRGLKHLKTLKLFHNKITGIERYQFPPHIELLEINHNIIASISDSSFKDLSRLRVVDLSANNLTKIDRKDVEISDMLYHSPPGFILRFNPLPCDCHLGWLKDWMTDTIQNKETLPSFQSPNRMKCRSPSTGKAVNIADVDRSSFLCKYDTFCTEGCNCCKFTCYCEYQCPTGCECFRGDSVMKVQRVECQSAGLTKIPELPDGATEIRLDGNNIADFPKFKFIALTYALDVFLNHSNLQTIHNCSFWGMKVAQRLYLNDNRLYELPVGAFTGLYELKQLFLHNNNLHVIDSGALLAPPLLRTLTLHDNDLVTLAIDDLYELVNRSSTPSIYSNRSCARTRRDASKRSTSLTLRGNPWSCEPSFACSFLNYLQTFSESIEDLQFIQCIPEPQVVEFIPGDGRPLRNGPSIRNNGSSVKHNTRTGRKILDLQFDICSNGLGRDNQSTGNITVARMDSRNANKEKLVLIAGCVLMALFLALIIAVFLNRHLLQVLCFTRFGCRPFKAGKDTEEDDRPYDAFVCHSNKDAEFVLQQLRPRLENGDKPFNLCIHCRDLPGGAYMGDSIVRSVRASKRTILVLSENFLESEYCKFVFQADHEQLMREKKSRMIILLLDNLDPSKVKDADLKLYLRTQTYLKVGEQLFWQKLVFAMPDVKAQQRHRRQSDVKDNAADPAAATRLPSTRDLEYMDRERRMSEQQQLQQQLEQRHIFEMQQQQLLRQQQQQQQQQHPQVMAQTPLIQYPQPNYPQPNYPLHNPQHPQHEHHQHLLHHPQYHSQHPDYSHYEEQQIYPQHQQALLHNHPHSFHHHHHPYSQQPQIQQHDQLVNHERPSRRPEMYEIPSLDSPSGSHYNLAKTDGVPPSSRIQFLGPVISGYPGINGLQGAEEVMQAGGGRGLDGPGSSGSGSLRSTHVNSAFNNSDDSSTSGYHNGSCGSCGGGHYEEVGPGSSSVMNTPVKVVNQRIPPPVPRKPNTGFVPIDRYESVNTC